MPEDLSYLANLASDEDEKFLKESIEREILKAISQYLNEVADTMETNNIECLNAPTVRAMANELVNRNSVPG